MIRSAVAFLIVAAVNLPQNANALTSNWSTTCKLAQCGISTSALEAESRNPVLTMTILLRRDGSEPQLVATLPLGTALEPGARANFGGISLHLKFKSCYPDGCRAHAILDADLLKTLAAESTLTFRYFAQSSERQIAINLPLDGLAVVLAQLPAQ